MHGPAVNFCSNREDILIKQGSDHRETRIKNVLGNARKDQNKCKSYPVIRHVGRSSICTTL